MDDERDLVASHRLSSLADKFHDKSYRDGYVAAHTRGVLARQMRNFRGERPQADYATEIGKQKTVVSRLENPAYTGWSLRTMLDIARKENVAVLVRFVDFPTFLGYTEDYSDATLAPPSYSQSAIDRLAAAERPSPSDGNWALITIKQEPDKPIVISTSIDPPNSEMIASNKSIPSRPITRPQAV